MCISFFTSIYAFYNAIGNINVQLCHANKAHLATLKKMIFALCSISLIKMSSYNITLGKNGPNLILLNINNVI